MTYPTPATPLPWARVPASGHDLEYINNDFDYIVHAANAFPHLVAALEEALPLLGGTEYEIVLNAIAIARGEVMP